MMHSLERGRVHPTASVSDRAEIGRDVTVGPYAVVHDGVSLGDGSFVGAHCVLGEPQAAYYHDASYVNPSLSIGAKAVIRSGTVLYAGSTIGPGFETGHRATVREGARIGQNLRLGTQADVQGHCRIGDFVRIHSNVFVAQQADVGDFVWLFPHVVITDDPHPPSNVQLGVTLEPFCAVGAKSVLLPGVTVGRDSLVAAGSVVRDDVAEGSVVAGVPARRIAAVADVRSRDTGAPVYPWRHTFERGMPWEHVGYEEWARREGR
jgi:acetyltransferase-like isoleucine patch superfamily enzyme